MSFAFVAGGNSSSANEKWLGVEAWGEKKLI